MFIIQETMLEIIPVNKVSRLWRDDNFDWLFVPSVGNSDGLLSIWDKGSFAMESSIIKERILFVKGSWLALDFNCVICNIYAPCETDRKNTLWKEILILRSLWIVLGA
ncbi:hypothetical protein REPUB_Repub05bG0154300 [Reevesia pubescens]